MKIESLEEIAPEHLEMAKLLNETLDMLTKHSDYIDCHPMAEVVPDYIIAVRNALLAVLRAIARHHSPVMTLCGYDEGDLTPEHLSALARVYGPVFLAPTKYENQIKTQNG